jgi:hypothetical protein
MAAKPFENRTICPVFEWLAILFLAFENRTHKAVYDHSKTGRSGFWMLTGTVAIPKLDCPVFDQNNLCPVLEWLKQDNFH